MVKLLKALLLTMAVCGHFFIYTNAVPLLSSVYNGLNDEDDDDTEVIEITSNGIEEPSTPSKDIIDLSFFGSAIFGTPDKEVTADLIANYTPEASSVNPEELGSYLEGDILVPTNGVIMKNGITSQSSRWANGIVPFEIRGQFGARDMATIEHAMEQYHQRTCIRFVPRSSERDYVSIVSGNSGCWSSVGRIGGKQEVNLQSPGCLGKPGTAIHELMHALGFLHEQNRQERDGFVAIQYENIQASARSNFEKASQTVAFGVPYDYNSVMHYSANAFSTNGRPTIVAMQAGGSSKMGQRDGFSAYDVEKLNKMYDCGYGGGAAVVPALGPVPAPGLAPAPMAPATMPNNIIGNFLGGLISGLGLGDENEATPVQSV